jgi:hypothetical protein
VTTVAVAPSRHGAGEEVRAPEKPRDERSGRAAIHLLRSADLLDASGLHHDHAIGQDERLA